MDFELKPISQPIATFVIVVSSFMTGYGIYLLAQADADSYVFFVPFSLIFLPWLPLWGTYLITAKVRFTNDAVIKSSFFGKREMKRKAIQFFGVLYSRRHESFVIDAKDAFEFSANAKCQIVLSEKPAQLFKDYPAAAMKFPFQKGLYDKIKAWLET